MVVQKTGLAAVFETAEFQAGLKIYKQGLDDAKRGTDKTADSISTAGKEASTAGGLFGTGLSGGMIAAGAAALGFVAIAGKVVGAIGDMISGTKDLIKESVVLASRWDELSLVAQLMGQKVGFSSQEILDLNQQIQDAGIRADVANKSIAQLIRMEMNPQMALELGKVAQNLAVISQDGADSSATLDRLMLGIQRLSPIILRYAGANVNLEQSYKRLAKELGISTDQLTQVQKQQAAYNAVMAEGAKVTGIYELSMESAGKQMRTLTGREIPTLKAALGAPFQGAFLNVAKALRKVVSTFTDAISEGGRLYPLMIKLGAIADILTEALGNLARRGTEAVISFLEGLSVTFSESAQSAFSWGFDLVLSFAQGIVDAAASVLVTAINFVGDVLASWLSPSSPPKVAPDIVKWGIGAMTEYLKGFTRADFGVLRDIQSPLKTALDIMVSAGKATKKGVTDIFLGLSEEISKALSDGILGQDLLAKITKQAGKFGGEIAKLVKGEFALAEATNEVAEAQERINDAMKKQEESEKAVRSLTNEYNRLLRAGASDETLRAQLAQINAAEDQARLAAEQRSIAEGDLEDRQETLDLMKEQVHLQGELVRQLLQLAKAAIIPGVADPADKKKKGAGKDELEIPGIGGLGEGFELDKDAFVNKIRDAVAAAKAQLLASWAEAWEGVKQLFREKFGDAIQSILDAWEENLPVFEAAFNRLKVIYAGVLAEMRADTEAWGLWAEGWWAEHGGSLKTIWDAFLKTIGAILKGNLIIFNLIWDAFGDDLIELVAGINKNLKEIVQKGLDQIGDVFDAFAALIKGDQTLFWNEIREIANNALEILKGIIDIGLLAVKAFFKFHFGEIVDRILEIDWWQIGSDIVTGIKNGVSAQIDSFINTLVQMAKDALSAVKKVFGESSPSKAFAEIGVNVVRGFESGIQGQSAVATRTAAHSMVAPAVSRTMNVNQVNNIQSPMDLASFRAMFNQVVREQFSGA